MMRRKQMTNETLYRCAVGFGVPIGVTVLGILAKKLTRNVPWDRSHFYLGTELTLAAFAAALANFGDLFKPVAHPKSIATNIIMVNVGAVFIVTVLLFLVLSLHQDWEPRAISRPKASIFWLIGVSKMIGFCLLATVSIIVPAT
jgi:hypothetical protein